MISIKQKGDFKKTERFLKTIKEKRDYVETLRRYGQAGVEALEAATPKDTGVTAGSWSYEVVQSKKGYTIYWRNSSQNEGANIALLIQYGHATGWGRYVKGIDYINPTIKKVFEEMADTLWKEVQQA